MQDFGSDDFDGPGLSLLLAGLFFLIFDVKGLVFIVLAMAIAYRTAAAALSD